MKFNFRKIAPIVVSAILLGSTIGIVAADLGEYPAPFVTGGQANVNIIYGADAASMDVAAMEMLSSDLSSELASETATGTTGSVATSGETAQIKTSGQELYLGDYLASTKETLTKSDLPTVLADGTVLDDDAKSYDYTQKILVPNTTIKYGRPTDLSSTDEPVLYVNFDASTWFYNTTITFPTAVNVTKLIDQDITLFGNQYTFSGNTADLSTTSVVLYAAGTTSVVVSSGESKTVNVGGVDYTIEATVEDTDDARIVVNGESKSIKEGNTYKVAGLDIYAKSMTSQGWAGGVSEVELRLGSEKVTLATGEAVEIGTTDIDGTLVQITSSAGKVSKIAVGVKPYSLDPETKYVAAGTSFTDPVWKTFKMDFSGANPALDASSKDVIVIKPSADTKASLEFTNKAGEEYNLNILKASSVTLNSSAAWASCYAPDATNALCTYNATTLGVDDYKLVIDGTSNITENDYFIVGNNEYTQIFRLTAIRNTSTKSELDVKNVGTGESQTLSMTGLAATLPLFDGSTATLTLNASGTGVSATKFVTALYTKSGAKIDLSQANAGAGNSNNASKIVITEETAYNDGIYKNNIAGTLGLGDSINVTIRYKVATKSGYDMELISTTADTALVTVGDYDKKGVTNYGSYIVQTGNEDKKVTIYYGGTATNYGLFFGEIASSVSAGTTTTSGVTKLGAVGMSDTEAAVQKPTTNLIVIGDSCVNSVALKLASSEAYSKYAFCGAKLTELYGMEEDTAIIKQYTSPYSATKIAVLVAGWEMEDTMAAAKYLRDSNDKLSGLTVKKLVKATDY